MATCWFQRKYKHVYKTQGQCVIWLCQKSIYLGEQGGRSQPGLKNWVSGRLSPSALSQLGMRVLHHPMRSVTPAGQLGGKSNGVSCSLQTPSVWHDEVYFAFYSRLHCTWTKEVPRWLFMIKAITAAHNKPQKHTVEPHAQLIATILEHLGVCTNRQGCCLTFSPSTCLLTRKHFLLFASHSF